MTTDDKQGLHIVAVGLFAADGKRSMTSYCKQDFDTRSRSNRTSTQKSRFNMSAAL